MVALGWVVGSCSPWCVAGLMCYADVSSLFSGSVRFMDLREASDSLPFAVVVFVD